MSGTRAEARLGLSRCHIRPRYFAELSEHGSYLAVKAVGVQPCTDSPRLGDGDTIHTSFALRMLKVRFSGSRRAVKVTIGDVDLPAFVSNGYVYIQAPLPLVFQAFGEDLSDFVRDLEVGISTTGAPHFHL